ncbi:MAG: hypothetical protein H0W89_02365 [Candidatus Levybacteria bacterium]|nr:hypothetical protein [Candidatus Levybacteria bacterium]
MTEKKKRITTTSAKPKRVLQAKTKVLVETKDSSVLALTLGNHFKESWQLFKQTFLSYLKLIGIGIVLLIGLIILGLIIVTPLTISLGGAMPGFFSNPSPLQIIGLILMVVLGIGSAAVFIIFFLFLSIGGIFIIANQKRLSVGELFTRAKPLIVPYLFASVTVGFVTTGGWFVLIIPGLLFSLFFIFVSYIVVLEKKRGIAALKRSYALVKANFWKVVGRILIIQVIIFAGSYLFETLAEQNDIFGLFSFIFSIVAGWFTQVYMYLLYKQLAADAYPAQVNLRWIWITAVIGWLLAIGLIMALGTTQLPALFNSLDIMDSDALSASKTI